MKTLFVTFKAYFLMLLVAFQVYGQVPRVTNITPEVVFPTQEITLEGSNLVDAVVVNIGGAHAEIITATETSLTVKVPISARSGTLKVMNSDGLVGYSSIPLKYTHSGTDSFDINSLVPVNFEGAKHTNNDLCACDIDNDGDNDIIGAGQFININLNENGGTQAEYRQLKTSYVETLIKSPKRIACGDLNGDGYPDLAFTSDQDEFKDKVYVVFNTQNITSPFKNADVVMLETVGGNVEYKPVLIDIEIRDLDQDGKPEIVVANNTALADGEGQDNLSDVFVYKNNTAGGGPDFSLAYSVKLSDGFQGAYEVVLEDINGDDRMDIVVAERGQRIVLLTNTGDFQFSETQLVLLEDQNKDISSIAVGDYNQDGLYDLVVAKGGRASLSSGEILIYKNTGNTQFTIDKTYLSEKNSRPNSVEIQDINGDFNLDIVVSTKLGFEAILRNSDNTNFNQISYSGQTGTQENAVRCFDMNGDGMPEIILSKEQSAPEVLTNFNKFQARVYPRSPISVCGTDDVTLYGTKGVFMEYTWDQDLNDPDQIKNHVYYIESGNGALTGQYNVNSAIPDYNNNEVFNFIPTFVTIDFFANPAPDPPGIVFKGTVCRGESIVLESAVSAASYLWKGPNGFASDQKTVTIENADISDAGTYTLSISQNNSCPSDPSYADVEVIDLDELGILSENGYNLCGEAPTTLYLDYNKELSSYQWYRDGELIAGADSSTLETNIGGEYTVNVTIGECEKVVGPTSITYKDGPVADFDVEDVYCVDSPILLEQTGIPDYNPNQISPYIFTWYLNGVITDTAYFYKITRSSSQEGELEITLHVQDNSLGCSSQITKVVSIEKNGSIAINTSQTELCQGDSVLLEISSSFTGVEWSTGESASTIWGFPGKSYSVNALTAGGCEASGNITLVQLDTPQVSIEVAKTVLAPNETVDLFATPGYASYEWSPAEGLSDPTVSSPTAAPTQTRTTYTVTVATESGCSSNAEVTIDIGGKITVYPEKAFTPNFDNHNDQWHIANMEAYPDCNVTIFTRSGIKVYEGKNYDNNKWNGTFNGKQLTEGAYFYVIECQDTENIEGRVTGSVSLIR